MDTMATDNILHYFVPQEILCQILSKYLNLDDISRFDTAICNNVKRPLFLECIGSEKCHWLGDKSNSREFNSHGISWLFGRKIKIRFLNTDRVSDDMAAKIAGFGTHLI